MFGIVPVLFLILCRDLVVLETEVYSDRSVQNLSGYIVLKCFVENMLNESCLVTI